MARRGPRIAHVDYWPGFVDVLTNLLLVVTFLLSLFMLSQMVLSWTIRGRDDRLAALGSDLARLSEQLSLARRERDDLATERARLASTLDVERTRAAESEARAAALAGSLDAKSAELGAATTSLAALDEQIAALRNQLLAVQQALGVAEAKSTEQQATIADLGQKLNVAMAQKVQELARYRSEFFGRLREVLGDRRDIRVVGDRFVFQSELLFDTASAQISELGRTELAKLATALKEISAKIPRGIDWVVRVDGHSDRRPIATAELPSNWHLSSARAIAVVRFLMAQGVPANRLVAAGFGEYQPVALGRDEAALRQNRRIEFKLTDR